MGQAFILQAKVRNQGDEPSAATTLRYYRSTDAMITSGDEEVGTDAIGALNPSATSGVLISLTAPTSAGTYYYGACVESVSGESDTDNNCSEAVTVTVSGTSAAEEDAPEEDEPPSSDRAALVALYDATDGLNWTNNANWLSDAPIGQWHGVTTNANGQVTVLFLGDNQLSRPIPPELGNLANLETLYLSGNQLSGCIPEGLRDVETNDLAFLGRLWCMNRYFSVVRLNKDRLLSRLGMTFLRKTRCFLFQGTCHVQRIVWSVFGQASSPSPEGRVSRA